MARLFIVQNADHVSTRYHDGGGIVAIAADRESLDRLLAETLVCDQGEYGDHWSEDPPEHKDSCRAVLGADAVVFDAGPIDGHERVWLFPDSGCC